MGWLDLVGGMPRMWGVVDWWLASRDRPRCFALHITHGSGYIWLLVSFEALAA